MAITTSSKRIALSGAGLSAFLIVVHATNDAFSSMLSALLPTLQARFLLSETTLALLVATLSFSSSVTQPLFGALSDRLGRRLVGALGVILTSSLLSLMGVVPNVYLLFGLLFVGGLGSAAFHPSGTHMARAAGERNKGLAVSIFSAGGTVGLALGPIIILFVLNNFGLSYAPWLMVPGVILGVMMYFLVPPQTRSSRDNRPKLFDAALFAGPVGLLCVTGILRSISFVTFKNAVPLWLVAARGVEADAPLLGWTLAAFALSSGIGGVVAGVLDKYLSRQWLITGSMLLAVLPLLMLFWLMPGSALFFVAVILAGALVNAALPLLVVSAQDLTPNAVATASGMLMGFTWGTAGVLYIGIGYLQESIGLSAAMSLSYLTMIPGAILAFYVLRRYRARLSESTS